MKELKIDWQPIGASKQTKVLLFACFLIFTALGYFLTNYIRFGTL